MSSLRASMQLLEAFRLLTDEEAKRLISDPSVSKVVAERVAWTVTMTRNHRPTEIRARVSVVNSLKERMYLDGRILVERPWQSHWVLTWGSKAHHEQPESLRRLDLRDSHRNPDGQVWERQTHKHLWSVADGNAVAYTPEDIPHDPATPPVTPDDYRAIFEAFAREMSIDLAPDYTWEDPPVSDVQGCVDPTIWEVP